MSDFVKGQGARIGIGLTEELKGEISGKFTTAFINPIGVYSANNTVSGYPVENAFDKNPDTFWYNYWGGNGQWIQVKLPQPTLIKGFRWKCVAGYRPKDFKIQGSANGSTWVDIHSGTNLNADGWQEFAFGEVTYEYYRWTFLNYYNSYIQLSELEIQIPAGNEMAFKITGKQYRYINGDLLDMEYKVKTVSLHPTIENALLLEFDTFDRFPTAEGKITVTYDAMKGNLTGRGGAVESFSVSFTPKDLVPEPNPGIQEYITVAPSVQITFITMEYVNAYADEHITVAPSVQIRFEEKGVINP